MPFKPIDWTLQSLKSLTFPGYCPECHIEMVSNEGWLCADCWKLLTPPGSGYWSHRTELRNRLFVAFHYSELARTLVHQMKFYGRRDIAVKLGRLAAENLKSWGPGWEIEAVVPVPLHPVRLRERGYDQNLLIAEAVALETSLPLRTDLIRRTRQTPAQSRLSDKERIKNLRSAFEPLTTPPERIPSSVLLVDDVIHTGSTAIESIDALKKHGRMSIYVLAACG